MRDDILRDLRIESIEVADPAETLRPVFDAAFAAAESSSELKRKNAISRAVFKTARELGFRVAWGAVLDDEAPDFYIWPAETLKTSTIQRHLDAVHALPIRADILRDDTAALGGLAASQVTALEERGHDWRTAVTWADGFGRYRVVTLDGPGAHRRASRAIRDRFSHAWGPGYRPSLRTVEVRDGLREYVEADR